MGKFTESEVMDALRDIIKKRNFKLTTLAKKLGIPYSSLQNYIYKRNRMPIEVYLSICAHIGIPADYPTTGKYPADLDALRKALEGILKPALDNVRLNDDLSISVNPSETLDEAEKRRQTALLAALVKSEYQTNCLAALESPINEED